ncbi:hypothetical protein SI65_10292 [Aspergillus cristatus]|uniref:CCHC-type domain-containing protein n=1 Tax=Aspergillus cristatus TaxID=573508 RepID=A0A1E3B042_ASPCR|nr:hypothetical protein SI65_10292 [Aspergillus cristatus]
MEHEPAKDPTGSLNNHEDNCSSPRCSRPSLNSCVSSPPACAHSPPFPIPTVLVELAGIPGNGPDVFAHSPVPCTHDVEVCLAMRSGGAGGDWIKGYFHKVPRSAAQTPKDLVERAERQRATNARQSSGVLAGQASFVAARKLPSGDVAIVANSAAGVEALRKRTAWLRAFGPGSVIQEPSWGVVAYHIPVKSMKLTPERMAEMAAELLRQNNWGEGSKIQYLGWLTRPGERAKGSILIDFTSPVVANRAIMTGVVWGKQIQNVARFCREGRMKLCGNCQKPGHIQSHCSSVFKCGHCASGYLTWECPSTKGQAIPVKCANCGEGHRPTSRECPVKIAAMNEAKQALADCPTYHRLPLHFRVVKGVNIDTPTIRQDHPAGNGIEASIHAPEAQREGEFSGNSHQAIVDLEAAPTQERAIEDVSAEPSQPGKALAVQKAQEPSQRLQDRPSYR